MSHMYSLYHLIIIYKKPSTYKMQKKVTVKLICINLTVNFFIMYIIINILRIKQNSTYSSPRFEGQFAMTGERVRFKFTSVCGHVMSLDFDSAYNNWDKVDPVIMQSPLMLYSIDLIEECKFVLYSYKNITPIVKLPLGYNFISFLFNLSFIAIFTQAYVYICTVELTWFIFT